jgi:hypothetical protein
LFASHPLFCQALRIHLACQFDFVGTVFVVGRTRIPPPVRIVVAGIPPGPSTPAAAAKTVPQAEAPAAKAIVIVTEAISAKAVFPEARLAEGIPSIETPCPEARPGAHTAESVAATHVAAKTASASESAMSTGDSCSSAAAHLRRR